MELLNQYDLLENASGANERKQILKNLHPLLIQGFVYAMSPQKIYHTSPPNRNCTDFKVHVYHEDDAFLFSLFEILDGCVKGSLRGNASKDRLNNLYDSSTPLQWKWGSRIIWKNMRCGVGWGLFCEVHKGLLKGFKAQLCGSYDWSPLKGVWYADAKMDGMRCYMVFLENGDVEVLSRSGKPVPGGLEIAKKIAATGIVRGKVLDGELFATDRFNSIGRSRSHGGTRENLKFYPFDMLDLNEWQVGSSRTLKERFHDLTCTEIWRYLDDLPINTIPNKMLQDPTPSDVKNVMNEFKSQGYEGAVLKCADSPYQFERTGWWLKAKPVQTDDYKLIDVQLGNGKYKTTTGNLVVDVAGVRVRVGTGLSDKDRNFFWTNREKLIASGAIIEVGHEGVTPDGSLNFPRFLRYRHDKQQCEDSVT